MSVYPSFSVPFQSYIPLGRGWFRVLLTVPVYFRVDTYKTQRDVDSRGVSCMTGPKIWVPVTLTTRFRKVLWDKTLVTLVSRSDKEVQKLQRKGYIRCQWDSWCSLFPRYTPGQDVTTHRRFNPIRYIFFQTCCYRILGKIFQSTSVLFLTKIPEMFNNSVLWCIRGSVEESRDIQQ